MTQPIAALMLGIALLAACSYEEPEPPIVDVVVDSVVLQPFQPTRHVGRL